MKDKGVNNVDVESGKIGELKDKTEIQNLRRSGTMDFYVTGATLKHFDRIHAQKLVMDALKRGEMPNDALLNRAGADREKLNAALNEAGWQPIPTFDEAVEKLAADKKAQVLALREKANGSAVIDTSYTNSKWYGMTDAQITAETRREAAAEIRRAVGKGELIVRRGNEPPTISPTNNPRWKTDVKLFVEKYLPGINDLNTPEGIKTTNAEAFIYGWINARTFGATDFYVDKSRFHNERQANEAWAMQKLGQITGEFQNLRAGGKTVEAIMNTPRVSKAVIALNESGILGKTLVNTLPSAVTFGGVETVREGVKTATGQSEGIKNAVANITRATTEGAVFGVLQPLPLKAQIPAVAASSYGIAKVFGADNAEAAQTALLNGIFAIAGGRTNAAKELNGKIIRVTGENGTAVNVRLAVEPNGRIRLVELSRTYKASLQVKVSELKAAVQTKIENAGQFLRDKIAVTDIEVVQAQKVIADYQIRQEKAPTLYASPLMPPVPTDPKVLKSYAVLAKKVLSDGTTNFTEFSRRLMGTSSKKGQEIIASRLDELFTNNASEAVVKANRAELEAFKDYKANFQAIADFRKTNKIPKYEFPKNSQGEATGTVAFSRAEGQVEFGTNTRLGTQYLGDNNITLRKQAMTDIQTKLGKLQGERYGVGEAEFLTHAEADSLIKLAQKNGGRLPEKVEIFVDRPTCFRACRGKDLPGKGLSLLSELYGIKELKIRDSYGTEYIFRPNKTVEINSIK